MDKLILIDGNSLTYRAYFATAYSREGILKNKDGFPVNAVITTLRMFNKIFEQYKPTHVVVAFDAGKKTLRHDLMPSYKEGRNKTPPELIKQFPVIKQVLDLLNIKHYEKDKIEADDIIGTLAKQNNDNMEVMVVSSDKDMFQLVDKNITILVPQNGNKENKVVSLDTFKEEFGYLPNQVIDFKGIVGDPSDNLPGVKGIGNKGALKLIQEYTTIENIYENIDNITGAAQTKLKESKDMALLCKKIATIDINVVIPFDLLATKYDEIITKELIEFLSTLGVHSLVKYYENKVQKKPENFNKFVL